MKTNKKINKMKLAQLKEDFEDAIQYHLISTNFKPLDARTKLGKPVKKLSKILDFTAYLISCATITFIITTVLILWM